MRVGIDRIEPCAPQSIHGAATGRVYGSQVENRPKLDAAFRTVLGLDPDVDLTQIAYGETKRWDSVAHMQLVASLEQEFDIMLDTDEVIAMSDYSVVERILRDNHGIVF